MSGFRLERNVQRDKVRQTKEFRQFHANGAKFFLQLEIGARVSIEYAHPKSRRLEREVRSDAAGTDDT